MSKSILLVEDEESLAEAIQFSLEREGFEVVATADGRRAIELFRSKSPELILLDLMLPGIPGLDICRAIRNESTVPIIILTAKDSEADKVAGLELGADDYVTKPFSMRELMSRVRANLRREEMTAGPDSVVEAGPIRIDTDRHEVIIRGEHVRLPPKEFELLELLVRRKGRLLTRDYLIDQVWGADYYGDTKTLDVHIKRIREKVEENSRVPRHVVTVRGLGYKFQE